jgi:putative DNA primase/helicase
MVKEKTGFTVARVNNFKCAPKKKQTIFWDAKTPNFGLRVTSGGTKSYIFETWFNSKCLRVTIGDAKSWSLGKAQSEAMRLKVMTDQGIDPREVLAEQKAKIVAKELSQIPALLIWEEFIEDRKHNWGARQLANYKSVARKGGDTITRGLKPGASPIKQDGILRNLLSQPLSNITRDAVAEWIRKEVPKRPTWTRMTDFNDMHQLHGLNAVKEVIDEAKTPTQGGLINNWSEPTALPSMPYVAPFDYELLPDALRGWIQDISENMQSPPDFSAVGAIVTLSSLIGARVKIAPKVNADWFVCPNLWGMIVGRSSAKKTPSLEPVLKPLYKMQLIESERMKEALREWEIESTFHELSIKGGQEKAKQRIKNGDSAKAKSFLVFDDPPPKPNERRFVVNDSTVEKLGEILSQNTWGTLCFRDELYGLLKSMDKQGQEGSRAFYLTSYNGSEPYTFDRIIRGTVTISRVCLSLLGGIQPSRLQEYITGAINGGAGDDGLLQRFGLAVYPDMKPNFEYIDRQPNLQAIEDAYEVFNRLALLEPNEEVPWRFDDESQSIFVDWLTDLEQTVRSDEMHPAMESHLLKYEKLIPSLALIFTLIDNPNPDQKIAKTELVRALAWDEYLRTHAERIYHSANTSSVTGSKRILSEIGKGKVHDGFTAREIAIRNWSGLDNVESVNLSLEVLVDHGYLKTLTTKSPLGGRESTKYIINPMIPIRNEKK